jgi:hypothetical protein
MGGQTGVMLARVSFLLFPRPFCTIRGVWLGGTQSRFCRKVNEFGTLLGPEETSGCWWMVSLAGHFRAWTV